jgi:diguanylate cyclase (GGDEF)-like protein
LTNVFLVAVVLVMACAFVVVLIRLRHARQDEAHLHQAIAELQHSKRVLSAQAHFDPLTGLANRALLADRFHLAIERAKRSKIPFAVVMIDLNGFKAVNDTYGHAAGDYVLVAVGKRLLDAVRASDTVARLGGDEFVLLIESVQARHELETLGQKLIDALSHRVVLPSGHGVSAGGSIGFALFPDDGLNMDDLLHVADNAMYECKTSGLMPLF